jgi:hypothetical protein
VLQQIISGARVGASLPHSITQARDDVVASAESRKAIKSLFAKNNTGNHIKKRKNVKER